MKKIFLLVFIIFSAVTLCAYTITMIKHNETETFKKLRIHPSSENNWVLIEPKFSDKFYKSLEAKRIGDNIILFQLDNGGWEKNLNLHKKLNYFDKKYIEKEKQNKLHSTIDNSATTTEIDFLSKLYNATKKDKYKNAAMKGINYLLKMQMENGGFPARYPYTYEPYHNKITYNDNATINVLNIFKKIIENDSQYNFVDENIKKKIEKAYQKGINCILKTQLKEGVWGAQYDEKTLVPCKARTFEPASIDTRESANIVLFLMSIDNPSDEIKESIEKAIKWFSNYKITNLKVVKYINDNGEKDVKVTYCNNCNTMWARMYDLKTIQPIFSDRTGTIKNNITDIQHERRIGYEWYTYNGNDVLKKYPDWKNKTK